MAEDDPTNHRRRKNRRTPLWKATTPNYVTFHLLCSFTTSGAVIGTSGSMIKSIQKETGVNIHAEHYLNRSDERIITIIGQKCPKKTIILHKENKQEVSPAQHGLIRVLERVWEVEAEEEKKLLSPNVKKKKCLLNCRLLADVNQIGYLKGKQGKRVQKMEADCNANIWVYSNVPSCAPPNHQVIEVAGVSLAVKRATLAVSQCLQDVPPHRPFSDSYTKSFPQQCSLPVSSSVGCASSSCSVPGEEEVVFRLLLSNGTTGGVIGKKASIVKALEDETGASIIAAAPVAESNDRVIHISAMENPGSQCSPAQDAVVCVFKRSIEVGNGKNLVSGASKDLVVQARLLISSDQIVCLIGVGGTIISELRKITHTNMWILRDDEVPPCAAYNDAVLKIEGSAQNVQHALFIVTGKLRNTIFCNNMVNTAGKIKEPSASGSCPSLDRSHELGQRATLTEGMHRLGLSHTRDHSPSLEPQMSKTMHRENSRGFIGTKRGVGDPTDGLENGSGRKSAIVMNTTLEILVPEYIVWSYGENESNLSRLREISGAKVSVHDPFPGSNEATLIISGTPDQTRTAQSVLQALILRSEK